MEIEISRLGKRFQHGWVFRNIDFKFNTGSCYGISGRNGSGKSTLLKIVSGLLSATEGKISYRVNNKSIDRSDIYTQVNIAAPFCDLIEEFTLAEMIHFHRKFKPGDQATDIEWAHRMQLEAAFERPIYQFSSGMKQRVKLALALFAKGPIIILDEPTTNLDDQAKDWFHQTLDSQLAHTLILIASNEKEEFKKCSHLYQLG